MDGNTYDSSREADVGFMFGVRNFTTAFALQAGGMCDEIVGMTRIRSMIPS